MNQDPLAGRKAAISGICDLTYLVITGVQLVYRSAFIYIGPKPVQVEL
jgi:hypothetical protein